MMKAIQGAYVGAYFDFLAHPCTLDCCIVGKKISYQPNIELINILIKENWQTQKWEYVIYSPTLESVAIGMEKFYVI